MSNEPSNGAVAPCLFHFVALARGAFITSASGAILPIARTPARVSHGDDIDASGPDSIRHDVGKPAHFELTGRKPAAPRRPDLRERLKFQRGGLADLQWRHRPSTSRSIRRLASDHGSRRIVPASMASIRRSISASQAVSASGSTGPSRLASSSAATFARASGARRRTLPAHNRR